VSHLCPADSLIFNNCITVVFDVDSGGGWGKADGIWELYFSAQFCYEPETNLKKIKLIKRKINR
jgi:hypothetical protein